MDLLKSIKKKAKKNPKKIVFPESYDDRILRACHRVQKEKIAFPILLGDPKKISEDCKRLKISSNFNIENPLKSEKREKFSKLLYSLRRHKGLTKKQAEKLVKNELYFGTLLVQNKEAHGMVAGARNATENTLRPAFQIIKTKERFHRASGVFLILINKKYYLFSDCAVNINPNPKELAEIAIDASKIAKNFNISPRIAMLSFSTKGSSNHPIAKKVRKGTELAKKKNPRLLIEGELQVDAALDPLICKIKAPKSKFKGQANVLIFPDLQSANISYKLIQRLGKARAIGPIIQGLKKPVNDLSRGCSVQDIIDLTAITVVEAQEK